MKPGSPGFQGNRLQEARDARCISAIALSEMLGVTKASIYQFESGETTPSPETLKRITEALNFPEAFFYKRSTSDASAVRLYFRSLKSSTRAARARAMIRHRWLRDIGDFVSQYVEFPSLNLPSWDIPDHKALTDAHIEDYATQLRRFWGLGDGPLGNVLWLLEGNGMIVAKGDMMADNLDAVSGWTDDGAHPVILLGTDKASAVRSRFDAAHELGHLILHRQIDPACLDKDSEDFALIEKQAHRFAGAFLLPKASFTREVFFVSLDAFRAMKPVWRTSIAMMLKRACDLGLVGPGQQAGLWRNLTRRGWKKQEPLDDELPCEEPRLLQDGIRALVEHKVLSRSELRAALPFAVTDLESLCGLESGFFDETPPQVRIINISPR